MLLETTHFDKLKKIKEKLRDDFGIIISEKKSLSALKQIKENSDKSMREMSTDMKNCRSSNEYVKRMLISECASLMIHNKEQKYKTYVFETVAPKSMLDSVLSGVDIKAVVSDIKTQLKLTESQVTRLVNLFEKEVDKACNDECKGKNTAEKLVHLKNKGKDKVKKTKGLQETLLSESLMLLETNIEEAEIMISTKGFAGDLQEMIEKLGRMTNEDLPPVTDHIRVVYGLDAATNFQESTHEVLQAVLDTLYTAKFFIDEAVIRMSENKIPGAVSDMDAAVKKNDFSNLDEIGFDDKDNAFADIEDDNETIGDIIDDEDMADIEEPLGRVQKESTSSTSKKKIIENLDDDLANVIQDQIISFKSRGLTSLPIKNLMIFLQRSGQNIDYDSLMSYLNSTEYNVSGDVIDFNDNEEIIQPDEDEDKIDKSLVKTARKGLEN